MWQYPGLDTNSIGADTCFSESSTRFVILRLLTYAITQSRKEVTGRKISYNRPARYQLHDRSLHTRCTKVAWRGSPRAVGCSPGFCCMASNKHWNLTNTTRICGAYEQGQKFGWQDGNVSPPLQVRASVHLLSVSLSDCRVPACPATSRSIHTCAHRHMR